MKRKETGQGLVEYALILVLVAVVVLAVLMILGPIIGGVFSEINEELSSDDLGPEYSDGYFNQSASTTRSMQKGNGKHAGDEFEAYYEFQELSLDQEEYLLEAGILIRESLDEVFEVLIEYAIEVDDNVLQDLISSAQQEIAAGNMINFATVVDMILSSQEGIPSEVQLAVILKAEPHFIDSYLVLEGTEVPVDAYDAAVLDLQQWEYQNPDGSGYTIQKLEEIWELVDQRNSLITELARPALAEAACFGISALHSTEIEEYIELAQQYEVQMPSCGS